MIPEILRSLSEKAVSSPLVASSRHVAAVVYKGRILSEGEAKYKTHPLMLHFQRNQKRIYLHAEIDAIVKAINTFGADILTSCDLYVARRTKGGSIGNSKPCEGCTRAISAFKIRNVYYT